MLCAALVSLSAFGAVDSTGVKLFNAGKLKQAQAFFESAVKQNPKDAESQYYNSGHRAELAQQKIKELH